jgi:ABC-type transporter Mla subunit MlaD
MKHIARIFALTVLFLGASAAFTQDTKPAAPAVQPATSDLSIKDTPASQHLIELSKKFVADQQAIQPAQQQAQAVLDKKLKPIQDELNTQMKALHDQAAADKKYKSLIQHIDDLQKQINDAVNDARVKLNTDLGTLQQNSQMEQNQITGLLPVVKQENSLPDDARYSIDTQKWTLPAKAEVPKATAPAAK